MNIIKNGSLLTQKILNLLPNLFKNQLLALVSGILIFTVFIPGCLGLKSNLSKSEIQPVYSPVVQVARSGGFPNSTSPLGVNLSGIADYSTELPFIDNFKSSRPWITQCDRAEPGCQGEWDTNESKLLNLDKNGWVKSLPANEDPPKYTRVATVLFTGAGQPNSYPSGKYVVLYDGEGTIEYSFAAKKDATASQPGRDVIDVDTSDGHGVILKISATDPNKTGNYIRNLRFLYQPDEALYKQGEIFHPIFLDKIKKFRSLRFMDWMGTNNSQQKEWQNRPLPDNVTYTEKGYAPLEVMIALSNKVKADPWFNMPHLATDEYMTNFAKMVKDRLDPNLKAYVEYSNEVWNASFGQFHYALEQGKARWGQDKGDAYMNWYGMRTAQMCDIWKGVFGDQKHRVVCLIGTQTAWKGLEKAALECPYWVAEGNKPCYQHGIDAYAITGYFSGNLGTPENAAKVESWLNEPDGGFEKAFQHLKAGSSLGTTDTLPDVFETFKYHADVAKKVGLQLIVYEGGQHIVGIQGVENNERLTKFFAELNRRPEMYDIYTQQLNNWKQAGGNLFIHFIDIGISSKWGNWGALEYRNQNGSPKYNALMDFIDRNPCWWQGCDR